MSKNSAKMYLASLFLAWVPSCGPGDADDPLDPVPVFEDVCAAFLGCPEPGYDSEDECISVHQWDYDMRTAPCQELVLGLEECLAGLTCEELDLHGTPDDPCGPEEDALHDMGCGPL